MELLEIAKLPTAENSAIHLHPPDNVAMARVPLSAGTETAHRRRAHRGARPHSRRPQDRARAHSGRRDVVHRYGQAIGRAKQTIEPGRHVHTHNLAFEELTLRLRIPVRRNSLPCAAEERARRFSAIRARTAASARATTSRWWRPAIAPRTPPS